MYFLIGAIKFKFCFIAVKFCFIDVNHLKFNKKVLIEMII